MASLSRMLKDVGRQQAQSFAGYLGEQFGSLAEFYLRSQFLEKAIQIDEYYDKQINKAEEKKLKTARERYSKLATIDEGKRKFVKAALIPRDDTYSQSVDPILFMFNPTELSISRQVNVTEMTGARTSQGLPKVSFGSITPYQLELAGLLFDTYEEGTNVLEKIQSLRDAVDFTKFGTRKSYVDDKGNVDFLALYSRGEYLNLVDTDDEPPKPAESDDESSNSPDFAELPSPLKNLASVLGDTSTKDITSESDMKGLGSAFLEYDDLQDVPLVSKHPPVYYFIWGEQNYMTCMITKLSYKLTMFLPDGTPVRALVDVSLKEVDMRNASRKFSDMQQITK